MAWELFRRDAADGFEMVGVDGDLLDEAPIADLPVAVEVSVTNSSTHPDVMVQTEAGIESVTNRLGGRIVGTVRSTTNLWSLVYLPSDEHARLLSEIPLPGKASIWVQPAVDPDWTLFDRVRPIAMEAQSMFDLGVMSRLHAAGDRGGARTIEHVVERFEADRVDSFVRAAGSVLVDSSANVDEATGRIVLTHRADPVDITPDAWTVRQIAERHGAAYAGWSCDVLGAGTARPSKRRWWARS